jgi:hypothetical protein
MSEIEAFFRHCPACGRRFEIRLVGKRPVGTREETYEKRVSVPLGGLGYSGVSARPPLIVQEDVPTTVGITDFNYTYKCRHCGHEWTELRSEERSKKYEKTEE